VQGAGIPTEALSATEIDDPQYGLQGWVAVHSTIEGRSGGGVRILPDVTRQEVELLAQQAVGERPEIG
jgi:glutamate dehydrogenase/leucine dehydrogenase